MRPPSGNRVNQGQHLSSRAIDYSASPDPYVYAPESGRITSYAQRGSGTNNAGNCLRLSGKTGLHQFAHLERTLVSVGSRVTKGQKIAVMGHTGYTIPPGPAGRHLHYWVKTSQGYVYPPRLYTEPFNKKEDEVANKTQVNNIYKAVLHRKGDAAGVRHYTGWDANKIIASMLGSEEFSDHQEFLDSVKSQLQDLKSDVAKLKKQNQELSKSHQTIAKSNTMLQQEINDLSKANSQIASKNKELVKTLKIKNNTIADLKAKAGGTDMTVKQALGVLFRAIKQVIKGE